MLSSKINWGFSIPCIFTNYVAIKAHPPMHPVRDAPHDTKAAAVPKAGAVQAKACQFPSQPYCCSDC